MNTTLFIFSCIYLIIYLIIFKHMLIYFRNYQMIVKSLQEYVHDIWQITKITKITHPYFHSYKIYSVFYNSACLIMSILFIFLDVKLFIALLSASAIILLVTFSFPDAKIKEKLNFLNSNVLTFISLYYIVAFLYDYIVN